MRLSQANGDLYGADYALAEFYAGMDTGYVSQNVYLYCASVGLGSVAHDLDRGPLAKAMNLRPDQRIVLAQTVGYAK